MNLLHGRIGKLKMSIPWNKLSSKPCELQIECVSIVVSPKGKENWETIRDTIHSNYQLKQAAVDAFATHLFQELIVSFSALTLLEIHVGQRRKWQHVEKHDDTYFGQPVNQHKEPAHQV